MADRLRWVALAGLILAAIVSLAPQWRSLEEMGERRTATLADPPEEVLVGVSWPFARRRDGMEDGLRLAQDEINQGGLAGGRPIRLDLRDDSGTWAEARRIALDFADTPTMSAVIGYDDIRLARRAAPILARSRLLHLFVWPGNPDPVAGEGGYAIRTAPSQTAFARGLAVAASRGEAPFRLALLWDEDGPGKELVAAFLIAQSGQGGRAVWQWPYLSGRADFRVPAERLRTIEADLIVIAGPTSDIADFLRRAEQAGVSVPILIAAAPSQRLAALAGSALERALVPQFYDATAPFAANCDFVARFRARFGTDPDEAAAQGYDALRGLAEAIRLTGSAEPRDLAFALRRMQGWEGAGGLYRFDRVGEVQDRQPRLVPGLGR